MSVKLWATWRLLLTNWHYFGEWNHLCFLNSEKWPSHLFPLLLGPVRDPGLESVHLSHYESSVFPQRVRALVQLHLLAGPRVLLPERTNERVFPVYCSYFPPCEAVWCLSTTSLMTCSWHGCIKYEICWFSDSNLLKETTRMNHSKLGLNWYEMLCGESFTALKKKH